MRVAHGLTSGVANVVMLLANQNITKLEHEMKTESLILLIIFYVWRIAERCLFPFHELCEWNFFYNHFLQHLRGTVNGIRSFAKTSTHAQTLTPPECSFFYQLTLVQRSLQASKNKCQQNGTKLE
jgi:hypothetical protein